MATCKPIAIALVLAAATLVQGTVARAADTPTITRPVHDLAHVLSSAEEDKLAKLIVDHRVDTGVQFAVLVITTTSGVPIADYGFQVASAWGGGSKKRSDGALLILAINDRRSRIEVGYDLEDKITDSRARRILEDMKPHLRARDYAGALKYAVGRMINYTGGMVPVVAYKPTYTSSGSTRDYDDDDSSGCDGSTWETFLIIVLVIVFGLIGAVSDNSSWSGNSSSSLWSSSSSSSSWSSSSSSSSFSSGSSSWGGGGGSFGGGGASSSW